MDRSRLGDLFTHGSGKPDPIQENGDSHEG
jgi:hypothetical protein